jgi:hypothetical protein
MYCLVAYGDASTPVFETIEFAAAGEPADVALVRTVPTTQIDGARAQQQLKKAAAAKAPEAVVLGGAGDASTKASAAKRKKLTAAATAVEGESEDDEASTTVTAEMKAEKKSERDSVGKRVFALSLQGETLQVWRPPEHTDPILEDPWIYNMCTLSSGRGHGRVDHRLILRLGPSSEDQRFVALYGV